MGLFCYEFKTIPSENKKTKLSAHFITMIYDRSYYSVLEGQLEHSSSSRGFKFTLLQYIL